MTEEKKPSGMDILRAQPMIDRILFVATTLRKLEQSNLEGAGGLIVATRSQADAKMRAKGKAEAYRDITVFVYQLFGDEMKERLKPIETGEVTQ